MMVGLPGVDKARGHRQSDQVLLHHRCPKTFEWEEADWWACQHRDRNDDEHAQYDPYCGNCRQLWFEVYGPPDPSIS
jgi:hypothetical protein